MKVFISWSGDLSQRIAEVIREWLPGVLQAVRPFFTPNDIEKGSRWASDIATELKSSDIGIFVITDENIEKPWIMFEAGAISRQMDISKICVLMFGIDSADLKGPLTQFQATKFEKHDFQKLIRNINKGLGESALAPAVLDEVFEIFWPRLEDIINKTIDAYSRPIKAGSVRGQREVLEEILSLTRSIHNNAINIDTNPDLVPYLPSTTPEYSGSAHEASINCLDTIIYGLSFENESLDVIEPAFRNLRRAIKKRPIQSKIKEDILEHIEAMISDLARERKENTEQEDQ